MRLKPNATKWRLSEFSNSASCLRTIQTTANQIRRCVICLFAALALQACSDNNSTTSGSPNPDGFRMTLSSTFKHPRCTNCHGFEENSVGRTHRQQNRSTQCLVCHRVSEWRAPIISFSFSNKSSEELCVAVKNKFSGNLIALGDHLVNSPLNRWGLEQGNLPDGTTVPTAPPNNSASLKAIYDRWVIRGAICD